MIIEGIRKVDGDNMQEVSNNVRYIIVPVIYGKTPSWYYNIILFAKEEKNCNFIKLNIFDLYFECSMHEELLPLFDEKKMNFENTLYWIYFKENGLDDFVILEKVKKFRNLYYAIKRRSEDGEPFKFAYAFEHKKYSSIIITEDGYVVDGGHRLAILKHLNISEVYVNVIEYKMLFFGKMPGKIKRRNKKNRKILEQKGKVEKSKKIKIKYNERYEFN